MQHAFLNMLVCGFIPDTDIDFLCEQHTKIIFCTMSKVDGTDSHK